MQARRAGICSFCSEAIAINDILIPVLLGLQTATGRKKAWVHAACAGIAEGDEGGQSQVCKHWTKRGECLFGDKCAFLHPPL